MSPCRGLGYKELFPYLAGECTLEENDLYHQAGHPSFCQTAADLVPPGKDVIWLNKPDFDYDEEKILSYMLDRWNEIRFSRMQRKKENNHVDRKSCYVQHLGISKEVFAFGTKIEEELKERFAKIDEIAEYNQLKVIHAMQASKVSEACLYGTTGYGYNDLGRDTLEQVYATCFGTEDALVRPQIACGTHALTTALSGNLRPGDELLSPVGKPYDTL